MSERHEVTVDTVISEKTAAYWKAHRAIEFAKGAVERGDFRADEKLVEKTAEFDTASYELGEAVARYEGWSRFFLVTNTNGHIHSSMNCSTCFLTTTFAWLPTLSGLTESDAVEEWGGILCSVCFPSAPVEWTDGENKKTAAEVAARKLEAARNKLPEVKKANTKRDLVKRKLDAIDWAERNVAERDDELAHDPESTNWRIAKGNEAEAKLPKLKKELARAEAALVSLEEAAEAAIVAAGLEG